VIGLRDALVIQEAPQALFFGVLGRISGMARAILPSWADTLCVMPTSTTAKVSRWLSRTSGNRGARSARVLS